MKSRVALILVLILFAASFLALLGQTVRDPLAPYRASDGALRIPGSAFTPELQHALFGGNDLQPFLNLTYYALARSPFPTAPLMPVGYLAPNPYVFTHPLTRTLSLVGGLARTIGRWFPPIDWGAALQGTAAWFVHLFTFDARAALTVDTTTVTDVGTAANTCTTSQTTGASDNAILVMLSERGTFTFQSVTYGTVNLSLIPNTAANGGTLVRSEIWGFVGTLPAGAQTMTATLAGGSTARMTCATVLLQGAASSGTFIHGTSNANVSTNAAVSFTSSIGPTNLGFAVATLQQSGGVGNRPTAVTGTGATATDLYGVGTAHCSGGSASHECAAGADVPSPGTAITWTNPSTTWVVSAVEVVAFRPCGGIGGANCYRIGAGGAWNDTTLWSNAPAGAACGCTPGATDVAVFNATPTGTTTLSGATTIAALDMSGYAGALDTSSANNWSLTINGNLTIQGTFLAQGSTISVSGNVSVLGASTIVGMGSSVWTVNGAWTNNSTSSSWIAGTGSVTITDSAAAILTFGNLGVNEFNNLTLDSGLAGGVTYAMTGNGLRVGGTLLIRNSLGGATGPTVLDTSASNLAVTAGGLTLATWGGFRARASAVSINGSVNVSAPSAYITNTGGVWTVTGGWTDASTSASWSFAAAISFRTGAPQTMTFGPQTGNEFGGSVTFDSSATAGAAYTMAGADPLDVGGLLTIQNSSGGASGVVLLDTAGGNLAVNAGGLTVSTFGAFNTRSSAVAINGDVNVVAANAYVTNAGGSWTVFGAWTNRTTSASWSFGAAMMFRAASPKTMTFTGSNITGNEFAAAVTFDTTATAGMTFSMAAGSTGDASLRVGGALTIRNGASGGTAATILDTSSGNFSVIAASLTLGSPRGAIRSEGSTIAIGGAVSVADANSYVVFGSAVWMVTGPWTNASTDGADWSAGTGSVTFLEAANATMAFANLGAAEFNNLVFDTTAPGGVTYGMGTNGLSLVGLLTVQNSTASPTGNTVLDTSSSNLTITAGSVTLGTNGTLRANGSSITVRGNWTVTAANAVFMAGTGVVVFAAAATINMTQNFYSLTVTAGTATLASPVTVSSGLTITGGTLTKGTNALAVGGDLTLSGGALLSTSGSVTVSGAVTISAAASYIQLGAGSWTVGGSWTNASTSASWSAGPGTLTFNSGSSQTMSFAGSNLAVPEFNNVVFDTTSAGGVTYTMSVRGLRLAADLTVQDSAASPTGPTILTTSSLPVMTPGTLRIAALGSLAANGSTVTFGSFDGASGTFNAGSSTLVAGTSGGTIDASQALFNLTVNPGVALAALSNLTIGGTLTVNGLLDALSYDLTVAQLAPLSGGIAAGAAGAKSFAGSVSITGSGYFSFGGGPWTFAGAWTNNSSSASWSAGTGEVTLDSATGGTMTFAGANLPGGSPEFHDLTFDGGASTVTFSLGTNPLVWAGTLTVRGTGTTTMATNGLGLTGGTLSVADGGVLSASTSSVSVVDVTMTGGTSGSIGATTGSWTVSGNWDTSGPGSTLALGTATATLTGSTATIRLAAGQSLYDLTIAGSASLGTALSVAGTLTIGSGASLTKTGQGIAFNALAETGNGTIFDGSVSVVGLTIANSDSTNLTTISVFSIWTLDSEMQWTHSSTVPTSTITFTIAGNTGGQRFAVTKDGAAFAVGLVNGSGQVIFTMLGSDPVVDVVVAAPCTGNRYWVAGTGTWSDTTHWSETSGGVGGCSVPSGSLAVTFDANSGSGTVTVNQNVTMASLNTAGWAGTLAIGANNFTVGGNLTHASGIITIGGSSVTGLTVSGNLILSGAAVLDGSGAASVVSVGGNLSIASATAYVRMGSGTWTFAGSWSNGSTSPNWVAGTGTLVFDSAISQTMTFGGFAGMEFNNVTFSSSAPGDVTFTMGTNALRWSGTLTIQDAAGTTTLVTSDLPLAGGSLVVGNGGILAANGSGVAVVDVAMSGGTSGMLRLTTGSWAVGGDWDTSGAGSQFAKGTSSVTLSGAGRTVKLLDAANGFYNLTVTGSVTQSGLIDATGSLTVTGVLTTAGNAITGGARLIISGGGSLFGMSASIAVSAVSMNDASANTLSLTSGSLLVSGNWDTSGPASAFVAGTSTVTLSATSGSIALGATQGFATLVLSGSFTLASRLSATSLTLASGSFAKGTYPVSLLGDLVLSGGSLASVSGDVSIARNVDVAAASSYIEFGSETWTIGGAWTNASTSPLWSASTATVVFHAASSETMAFAGTGLPSREFNTVVFEAGSSTVTFTLTGSALRATTVTVQAGTGSATVDTSVSGLPITADTVIVGAGGQLTAGASVLTVRSMDTSAGSFNAGTSTVVVTASGGTIRVPQALHSLTVPAGIATTFASSVGWSSALTLTGATVAFQGNLTAIGPAALAFSGSAITVAGSWDATSAASFVPDGSTITFVGSGVTIAQSAGQELSTVVIAGGVTLATNLGAVSLTVSASGSLTMTDHSIAFNALTVSGAVVDSSVNVSGLTVANDDPTARVSITGFAAWDVGRQYAWTYTSNLSSQTITWTLQGNPAGFLYHVTKDGYTFADGTVPSSGNVVLAMLGSDPNMELVLSAPPIPPWWQSPVFLGVLPLPFLMVVTMFAQRRRWRPTKAFLVDERGQLLREFALDPSCDVTYDQAREAGALEAVDKDVRVAKYNARAVRGDMLSLVVLAVGPADVEETEFARGLLLGIQDRLEDSTKARIAEARSAEEQLKSAREASYEERADLQTRARVFGDMVNAFTIARTKLDTDSQKLRKQDANLQEREESLAEVRASLEEQAARSAEREGEMERTATELKAQKQELDETEKALRQRDESIGPREEAVDQRVREATEAESDVAGRESLLAAARAQLTADLDEYRKKTEHATALQAELAEERKALDDLSLQLDEQTKALEMKSASAEAREKDALDRSEELRTRLAELEPREKGVAAREQELASLEKAQAKKDEALAARENELRARQQDLEDRETAVATRTQDLAGERKALDELTSEAVEERKALDAKADDLMQRETEVAQRLQDLDHLKANLGPREAALFQKESDLASTERTLADERKAFEAQRDMIAARALEVTQQMEQVKEHETTLSQDKMIFQDAKAAFEDQQRELDANKAEFAREAERRQEDLGTQERTLGEARLRLTKDGEAFEAQRLEKSQWIASKEIELEAKEQSLLDREKEIRAQAEENARRLSELAAREETLEIEGDKLDKARAAHETRKAETAALARDLEARTARFRQEEAEKGEELRTWQTTLESEQGLLKEQRETFEKEMLEIRESWAGRMIRVEQREEELREREAKVQTDVEWVAKNESEMSTREKSASETLKAAAELQAKNERVRQELEQRAMEVESRERDLHEEAADQSVALEKRAEALQTREAELLAQRAQWERELTSQVQKMKDREAEVQSRKESLDEQEGSLASREETLVSSQAALHQSEDRLDREKADALGVEKQLEAGQLELAHARERLDAESARLTAEADAVRQSLAAKDADLTSERERLERESSALQDTLGAKAKEMASREKAVTAHEAELRAEEQDLDARVREIESRERQAEAHVAELNARADALARAEADLKSRHGAFDDAVRAFESESAARQSEWKDLQATLKSQEAQLAASAETRQAEIRKRMEELEQRERSINAGQTQAQIERTRLEAQAKAQAAGQAELDAAAGRADKRFAELKAMEAENLRVRQEIEVERAAWTNRRSEELRQLEATRDAAAEQTQQAERLLEDSQRRAFVAAEAEKAAKRQAEELAAAQGGQEKRRAAAEKAEKDLEDQMAQLREASQRLGSKELELASRAKDLDALQTRLAAAEKKNAEAADSLKSRKASLDQEAERVATLAAQAEKRGTEVESRRTAVEAKLTEVTKREQILSTELQRADNLMDDLNRKEAELQTRDKNLMGHDRELATKEETLAQRDAELKDGLLSLERLRREQESRAAQLEHDVRAAADARKEADAVRAEAEKLKAQADSMQAEVAKNMRFLQKKALDVLDREEKIRAREVKVDEQGHLLESRAQILEQKDRVFDSEKSDLTERLEKMRQENEKLKGKLAEAQAVSKSTIDMDEWKRDIENRVKIIQKKALDLLDREEKLRKKEEELRALAAQLGVPAKA